MRRNRGQITVDEALDHIQSGDLIAAGMYTAEPKQIFRRLHEICGRVRNVSLWTCLLGEDYPFVTNPEYWDTFRFYSIFNGPQMRRCMKEGAGAFLPNNLCYLGEEQVARRAPDIYFGAATLPEKDGTLWLAPSLQTELENFRAAKIRILELNPHVPRVFGASKIHMEDLDGYILSDAAVFDNPMPLPGETDRAIARRVAALIHDGDTIQFGIGRLPEAISDALMEKRDLGIHTEMLGNSLGRLIQAGVVTNARKNFLPGESVVGFVWGSREFYDFIDSRQDIRIEPSRFVNDACIIGKNDNLVSVNSALSVDLTGQICSESIGTLQYSGTGGAMDFAMGAFRSRGGRGIIAMPSTTGNGRISRITAVLAPGSAVSIQRGYTDYVITEYGTARLRGRTIPERAEALIGIAHPAFRGQLREDAERAGYLG
ncbi:acetyl-CoA hydrolase/transferase family protein [Eubacterium pyruvativorans]|uniref:acetyl-CoA hydrolase/transferase family protein n=1 Tax=Eubacterium pyruvativorans TaxID=155865 RepID=UPI0013D5842C|nr:acetyl-CoA hydrolase/transferase family protein [Eubacterium pyruvativorans]